jgi:L-alanine-DL-glutamate epimerase-like enolase superfamily enzyme
MLTIEHIQTTIFRLPLRGALRWGQHHSLASAEHVLVRVTLSNGSIGLGESQPRPSIYGETADTVCHIIHTQLAPRLLGQPATTPLPWQALPNNHTAKGALDIALTEALAHSTGQSLADYLGVIQTALPVSYILGIGSLDDVLAEAERVYAAGVRVLKVKVGRDWQSDLKAVRALQQALPAVQLYADANETWQANNAVAQLEALREHGLLYCEEPLPVEQILARSALRAGQHLPLIADDSCFTERDLQRELALDTFDILNIKTSRTGYTQSYRMAQAAQAAGKHIMVGSQAAAGLGAARTGLFAATLAQSLLPCEITFHLKLQADIVAAHPPIVNGYIQVADLATMRISAQHLNEVTIAQQESVATR